jgi:tetratricopeptide (TPR) repeat protein
MRRLLIAWMICLGVIPNRAVGEESPQQAGDSSRSPALGMTRSRISSDFEIAQMKEQIARSRSFSSQISGHLNLGDLYTARSERATAVAQYRTARDIAATQRLDSRRASDLSRYATATSFAALAEAKLGNGHRAFELAEEAIRYSSDSAEAWNLYASAMTVLRKPAKAISAARNAVRIATNELTTDSTIAGRIDVAVYRYALASALADSGKPNEAERLLVTVARDLRAQELDPLRRTVARGESFEINSSARGDAAAYLSVLNRSGLRLAALLESRGDIEGARAEYGRVLETRTDDATALAALARLSRADTERERYFAEAFEANPFVVTLIREYQRYLRATANVATDDETTGGQMRRALAQMARGENHAARASLDRLLEQYPASETLRMLRRETEGSREVPSFLRVPGEDTRAPLPSELRQLLSLLADERLTPEQRVTLDRVTLHSLVTFDNAIANATGTILESGMVDSVPFRFSEPTVFAGTFTANTPLRLTYRILGASGDRLLLEPLRVEMPQ